METVTAVTDAVALSSVDTQKLVVLVQSRQLSDDLHEGKIMLQDIMEGYLEVNCVDK